ncbi:MAG TPA: response regulator [Dehalococcoidia bacterium]|jgi:DNA-binding response OmpR family regulator|nr:response regulator [Dehalococcoidia bacterium]
MPAKLDGTRRLSVLVVDDDQRLSKLIRRNLEDGNIQVVEASSGLDCIRIIHDRQVDLILLDLGLPDFNGWGILSLLRLTEPLRHIPVIVVTVEPPDVALMEKLKPDDYIQKPFDMRDLLMRVRNIVH